jgi:hypothetical protein
MARRLRRPASPLPITRLLVLAAVAVAVSIAFAAPGAKDPEDDAQIRIKVNYPSEEESQWLDRWAEKYRSKEPGSGFSVQPATDEESALPQPHLLRQQELWLRGPHRVRPQRPSVRILPRRGSAILK